MWQESDCYVQGRRCSETGPRIGWRIYGHGNHSRSKFLSTQAVPCSGSSTNTDSARKKVSSETIQVFKMTTLSPPSSPPCRFALPLYPLLSPVTLIPFCLGNQLFTTSHSRFLSSKANSYLTTSVATTL